MAASEKHSLGRIRVLMVTPFPEHEGHIVGGVAGVSYSLCQALNALPDINVDVLVPACAIEKPMTRVFGGLNVTYLPKVRDCRSWVKRLGLDSNVEFLGSISIDAMKQRLSEAHLMALCSQQETAPLSIAEAMAAGVPVVASDICGIPHMLKDGVTGFLVDPESVDDIALGL